jgi:hypothetical protein
MPRKPIEKYSMHEPQHQADADRRYAERMDAYFESSLGTNIDKLRSFAKFVPRQLLTKFLANHALFQHVLSVHGHIIECGVYLGAGLMTWAQFSAIYEPVNHVRRVVGFDTFDGFTGISKKDLADNSINATWAAKGKLAADSYTDLQQCVELYDLNRSIGHIPRVELVRGDAMRTIPRYLKDNQHLVVAMLYLDFDLYEPTKIALETFLPRMPKGAVLAFDELDQAHWPGETMAVLESVGLRNLRIRRLPFHSALSFAVLD